MKIFISWSGEGSKSQHVAKALKDWLPLMFQSVEPWYSKDDIYGGDRWNPEISEALDQTDFGILCLDKSNPDKPWLVFEAGAISKSVKTARVVPYLIEMEEADVPSGPLDQFQYRKATEVGTRKLVQEINDTLTDGKRSAAQIDELFDALWPQLKPKIAADALPELVVAPRTKTTEDLVKDVLGLVREIHRDSVQSRHRRSLAADSYVPRRFKVTAEKLCRELRDGSVAFKVNLARTGDESFQCRVQGIVDEEAVTEGVFAFSSSEMTSAAKFQSFLRDCALSVHPTES